MDPAWILGALIIIPLVGGLACWGSEYVNPHLPRWIGLTTMTIVLALGLYLWFTGDFSFTILGPDHRWGLELDVPWIPRFGISFHLGLDGLSLLLTVLSGFIGIVSVACSWSEMHRKVGFYYMNLMWNFAGIIGVFLAIDLFLFFFFWELMLVPMFFLIALWGHDEPGQARTYAAMKFFIYTQASGLLMFVAILALVFIHHRATGVFTFDYNKLLGTPMSATAAMLIMLGFFGAFMVKLPTMPFHVWLPDAHGQAPTAGSVILAGLMLKTAAYGLIRFCVSMFPEAAAHFAPIAMWLGVAGILWGAAMSFSQHNMKRLVAYMSVSHMGFIMMGVFAGTAIALQGVMITMLSHGVSSSALFIITGQIYERMHTRDFRQMSGLWTRMPGLPPVALFFAMASLGLPGMGNFVGEFLILLGTLKVSVPIAVVASLGLITAICYSLIYMQRAYYGPAPDKRRFPGLNRREIATMASLIAVLLWLGIHPNNFLHTSAATMTAVSQNYAHAQEGTTFNGVASR
ncbi:MAG TPA: NADH-quinone oxidoreductase subunit M [Nevskiaceae bacterium]